MQNCGPVQCHRRVMDTLPDEEEEGSSIRGAAEGASIQKDSRLGSHKDLREEEMGLWQ